LRISTVDARIVTIEVVSVTDTEIVGKSDSILLEHVARIDRLDFSSTKAWTYVGAVVGTIAAIFLIVVAL
jgi:hypothetical protein